MIEDFFTPDELEPVKGALNTLVDNLAHKLYNAGKLRSMQQLAIPPMEFTIFRIADATANCCLFDVFRIVHRIWLISKIVKD